MSKLSIFAPQWIDLVFENRNKEYGAYQLRQENPKTMYYSFFMAIGLLLIAYAIFGLISNLNPTIVKVAPQTIDDILILTDVHLPPQKKIEEAFLPPVKKQTSAEPNIDNISKPKIVSQVDATAIVPKNSEVTNATTAAAIGSTGSIIGTATEGKPLTAPIKPTNGDTAFGPGELDKNPEFPGGIKKFLNYVATNFKADEEIDTTIRVIVSFVVEKDGTMSNIAVRNNPGFGMGDEAIRVLKSMKTKWEAGMKDGEKVRAYYNLPITINISQ